MAGQRNMQYNDNNMQQQQQQYNPMQTNNNMHMNTVINTIRMNIQQQQGAYSNYRQNPKQIEKKKETPKLSQKVMKNKRKKRYFCFVFANFF